MRDIMLILHFIGLTMGLGTSFAHAFFGRTLSKLKPEEALKFQRQTKGLSLMGGIGSGLLLVSGIYLILPFWPFILQLPLLIAKLILFLVLVILIVIINLRAKRNMKAGIGENDKGSELIGKLALIIGVVIVILAVLVFH